MMVDDGGGRVEVTVVVSDGDNDTEVEGEMVVGTDEEGIAEVGSGEREETETEGVAEEGRGVAADVVMAVETGVTNVVVGEKSPP